MVANEMDQQVEDLRFNRDACAAAAQCTSGVCRRGACFQPLALNAACQSNDDCSSGLCAASARGGPPVCQRPFLLDPILILKMVKPDRRIQ